MKNKRSPRTYLRMYYVYLLTYVVLISIEVSGNVGNVFKNATRRDKQHYYYHHGCNIVDASTKSRRRKANIVPIFLFLLIYNYVNILSIENTYLIQTFLALIIFPLFSFSFFFLFLIRFPIFL